MRLDWERLGELMAYLEPLPEGCPPDDSEEVTAPRIFFRLVKNNPSVSEDFKSQRAEKPNAQFGAGECQARGISMQERAGALELLLKLPKFKGQRVCEVTLRKGAGRIKQTGKKSHYTWWPLASFNILTNCQVVGL